MRRTAKDKNRIPHTSKENNRQGRAEPRIAERRISVANISRATEERGKQKISIATEKQGEAKTSIAKRSNGEAGHG